MSSKLVSTYYVYRALKLLMKDDVWRGGEGYWATCDNTMDVMSSSENQLVYITKVNLWAQPSQVAIQLIIVPQNNLLFKARLI